jgi:polysaccharide biosynthesis/export protein
MKTILRVVVACVFASLSFAATAQSVLDALRGGQPGQQMGTDPIGNPTGPVMMDPAVPQPANPDQFTTITKDQPALPQGAPGQETIRRRVQELELRKLHQDLDRLEAGEQRRNEFQNFLLQATGKEMPVFGTNLFRNTPSTFAPVDNIPVTPDYVIGPGDEVIVTGWGQINVSVRTTVDRNGAITIPRVGTVNVAGLRYQDLTPHLKAAFGRLFRNFDLTATLGQLRSIQVFVVGQARRPGTYTVSSLSTLVSAVFAAGGPSSTGSMRSIQLKRDNRVVADFDLYDLLISGDKSRDARLMPGDIIQFTPVGPLVAMTGAVNTPAIYELKQSAPLFDVLRWAGGLATTAQGQKVTVERTRDRRARSVEEMSLDVTGLSAQLRDGDIVTVHSFTPRFDNAITLRGNVAQPGRFPWREGMRIKDLIPEREALLSREYLLRRMQIVGMDSRVADIMRQQTVTGTRLTIDDLNQRRKPIDELDPTIGDTIRRMQTEAEAARFLNPNRPDPQGLQLPREDAARLADPARADAARQEARVEAARIEAARLEAGRLVSQIRPPSNEVNWDYAVIERINNQDLSTSLVPFNLAKALEGDTQHNLVLQRGDIVTIFSKDDLQVPSSRKARYVRLEGELNHAGVYELRPGETLRQLIVRVGGLTPNAYLFGAVFTRESTRIDQQKNLDEALNRLERDVLRFNIQRAQNVTSGEDTLTLEQQARSSQLLINRLRQIRATGRIVLELPEQAEMKNLPDIALEDGDRLLVPSRPSMVSVFGSVYAENSFIYRPEKQVSDYLSQAGGPTKSADRSSAYVLRADGSVISRQQAGVFSSFDSARLAPGDSIVMPEDLDKTTIMRNLKDIAQIFYQFGLGAAALKVLRD